MDFNDIENSIDKELFDISNKDILLKKTVQKFLINQILIKKKFHILWHIFHLFSTQYPNNPTIDEQFRVKNFILSFKNNLKLGCSSCSENPKDTFIENSDIDLAVSSRENLIKFFCDYHIEINSKYRGDNTNIYNKEIYNIEFIINRYANNNFSEYIENKYKINLFKLFQNNTMNDFFNIFTNQTVKIIHKEEQYDLNLVFFKID
jgi:hypothetical protein